MWEWDLDDYDPETGFIKSVRLSMWMRGGVWYNVDITITRRWVQIIDFTTMRLQRSGLTGGEMYHLGLNVDIVTKAISPLDPKVTAANIPELWTSKFDWEQHILIPFATEWMAELETGNRDPDTVSQHEKLYIGWRLDDELEPGATSFADFEQFVRDNIDSVLEIPRTSVKRWASTPTPLSTTAEQEFYRIDGLSTIWKNKQRLMAYIKSEATGAGSFALKSTTGSHGDMKTTSIRRIKGLELVWDWKLSDYDPVTSTVRRVVYKTKHFNDIVHTDIKFDLGYFVLDVDISPLEQTTILADMEWSLTVSLLSSDASKSSKLKMYSALKPAVMEGDLDAVYAKALHIIEQGDTAFYTFLPGKMRYIGWRYNRRKGEDTTWPSYIADDTNPSWETWDGILSSRQDGDTPAAKRINLGARLIYV
jgi:hypothetical protein